MENVREENKSIKEGLQKLRLELHSLKASMKCKKSSAGAQRQTPRQKTAPTVTRAPLAQGQRVPRERGGVQKIFHEAKGCAEGLRMDRERKKAHSQFVKRRKALAKRNYPHFEMKRLAKRILKYRHEMFTFHLMHIVWGPRTIEMRGR